MKVMWFINNEIPFIGDKSFVNEGWISGMLNALIENVKDIDLILVYPQKRKSDNIIKDINNIKTIGYYNKKCIKYNKKLVSAFSSLIKEYTPDVIHSMGSEYPHTYSLCLACKNLGYLDRLIISIQGLISECANKYTLGLPYNVIHTYTFRDILKGNIYHDSKSFFQRGYYEKMAFRICKNVIGRTEWDYACVKQINPDINYYFNNEVLRSGFYDAKWSYDNCQKNTIFISQGGYPIKGLHFAIEAMSIVRKKYPNVQLKIAGHDIVNKPIYRLGSYGKYIKKLIKKYDLENNIKFVGLLNEKDMLNEYLKSNIFISPSVIENSPNSLGEAMILGMPVISSDVGGVKSFIEHGKNGYIYPCTESNMLAYFIMKYFDDVKHAINMGRSAKNDALVKHDKKTNAKDLYKIYKEICSR